jgi:hypothetical protein
VTTNEPASVAAVTVLARWEQGTGALAASAGKGSTASSEPSTKTSSARWSR